MYLYGSYGEGRQRKESDVDIAVLIDPEKKKNKDRIQYQIEKKIASIFKTPEIDIKLIDELPPIIKHQIALNGQLIIKKTDDDRIAFIKHALREYEDTQHLRDIQNFYMEKRIKQGIFGHNTPIPLSIYE